MAAIALAESLRVWLERIRSETPKAGPSYVARRTGLPQSTVSRILRRDRPGMVRIDTIDKIAETFEIEQWQAVWYIQAGQIPAPAEPRKLPVT